jgi:hypothetical protein
MGRVNLHRLTGFARSAPAMQWRKLKFKAKLESASSCISFERWHQAR